MPNWRLQARQAAASATHPPLATTIAALLSSIACRAPVPARSSRQRRQIAPLQRKNRPLQLADAPAQRPPPLAVHNLIRRQPGAGQSRPSAAASAAKRGGAAPRPRPARASNLRPAAPRRATGAPAPPVAQLRCGPQNASTLPPSSSAASRSSGSAGAPCRLKLVERQQVAFRQHPRQAADILHQSPRCRPSDPPLPRRRLSASQNSFQLTPDPVR